MIRNFLYQKGNSNKYWRIAIANTTFTTTYGVGYKDPTIETKAFDTEAKCQAEAEKEIQKKLKEAYEEVPLAITDVPVLVLKEVADAKKYKTEKIYVDVHESEDLINELCTFTWLKDLTIYHANKLPETIGNLTNLDHLQIKEAKNLKELPESIGNLTKLTYLSIEYTEIAYLPESLGNLKELKSLYIQHNLLLKEIPQSIGQLQKLNLLWLNRNRETPHGGKAIGESLILPDTIGDLENLKELSLTACNLIDLPATVDNLKKLEKLRLDWNLFKNIPPCIFELENLETLEIKNSPIEEIPLAFAQLENLTSFSASLDKVKNIPQEILETGEVENIRDFLLSTTQGHIKNEKKDLLPIASTDLEASVASHQEALEKFHRAVKDKIYKEETKKRTIELIDFLTGKSDSIPQSYSSDVYYFKEITKILHPFKQWSAVDYRILAYITQDAWSFKKEKDGYFEGFYDWLCQEIIANAPDEALFEEVLEHLKIYDLDEQKQFMHRARELTRATFDKNEQLTSLGKYLLKYTHLLLKPLVENDIPTNLLKVYAMYQFEALVPYLDQITKIDEYKGTDGQKHLPYGDLDVLCQYRPELFEQIILETLENIDCQSCKMETARILLTYYGKKYDDLAYNTVQETLKYITDRKNKNNHYDFSWSLAKKRYTDNTAAFIDWILKTFGDKAKELIFNYVENTKILDLKVIEVAVKNLGQDAVDIAGEALDMTISDDDIAGHFRQAFHILATIDYSKYYDKTWGIAANEFEKVSETACLALSKLPTEVVLPKAKSLLKDKQAHKRKAAALILSLLHTKEAIDALLPLLTEEKNDDVRNMAVGIYYQTSQVIDLVEAKNRIGVAEKLGKLQKPIAKWLDETTLPIILWQDKSKLTPQELRYLFYRQKTVNDIILDHELRDILPLLDIESATRMAEVLINLIAKNGGFKAVNRFAMSILGALGGDSVVDIIANIAIKENNVNACTCLGLMNSFNAARALDKIMQAFKTKYPNVREAASEAFDAIATRMNLTPYELKDKMLPTFDFDGLSKMIKVNGEDFTVTISSELKFVYTNSAGKIIKTLPKLSDAEKKNHKEEANLLRESIKQLQNNLEHYLVIQRKWNKEDWENFFLKQPLANAFAQSLLWGTFGKDKLETVFYLKDSVLKNVQDQGVTLDANSKVILIHPLSLPNDIKQAWVNKFDKEKITPPFLQLKRKIFAPSAANLDKTISHEFEDKEMSAITFKSRAEKLGWRRGSVIDSGAISAYRKEFSNEITEVFIKTKNLGVGSYDYDSQMSFEELFFVKQGSIAIGSYVYDEPHQEDDERLIPLGEVNHMIYSEAIYDLHRILQLEKEEEEE